MTEFGNRVLNVIGCGGHGRVVLDAAFTMHHWTHLNIFDDRPSAEMEQWVSQFTNVSFMGTTSELFDSSAILNKQDVFVAVGENKARQSLLNRLRMGGHSIVNIVHSSAVVSEYSELSTGVLVCANATVNPGASIGFGAIVNTGAVVEHDCTLRAGVHLGPGAVLAGTVCVGEKSFIGAGSAVRNNINIGANVVVGAGSVVVSDVPDGTTVFGVPARQK